MGREHVGAEWDKRRTDPAHSHATGKQKRKNNREGGIGDTRASDLLPSAILWGLACHVDGYDIAPSQD